MKLLALDTSTDVCSVALLVENEITVEHCIDAQRHAAIVMPMIERVMASAQLSAGDLNGIVYGRGPGSFTGVRIGVSVTQGIALGADIGVIGISTLQSIAQGCLREFDDTRVVASIDARMDEVYFCAFERNEHHLMIAVSEERVCLPEQQPIGSEQTVWAGSGAQRYAEMLHTQFNVSDDQIRVDRLPHAQDLITLALPSAQQGRLLDPATAVPVYLRNKVAQTTQERAALKNH